MVSVTSGYWERASGRIGRIGITGALLASSLVSLVAPSAHAQDDALLSLSTVVPANVAFYAETRLDTTSDQLIQLDEILAKLGSEDSLIDEIENATDDTAGGVSLDGAEIAVAVLPSALESTEDSGSLFDEVTDVSSVEDATDAASSLSAGAESEGTVVVILAADPDALEAEALDEAGIDAPVEEYLGIEIITVAEEGETPSYFARIDDFMITGQSADDIKLFIDASLDGGESLASLDAFTTASLLLPQERVAFAFANGPSIIDALADQVPDPTLLDGIETAFAAYTGYTGLTVAADPAGIRIEMVNISLDPVPATTSAPSDLTMAERMPINTVVFANGFELGQSTLMKSVGLLFVAALSSVSADPFEDSSDGTPEAAPEEPMTVDEMYDSLAQLFGFNLKVDLIEQLTGEFGFGVWGVESGDPSEIGAALVSGVDDEERLGDTIGSITFLVQAAGQGDFSVSSRQLETGSINNVEFEAEGVPLSLDFGVVDDEFILGIGDGADMVTTGPTESLADSESYQTALSYLPADHNSVYYVDIAALTEASAELDGMSTDDVEIGAVEVSELAVDSFAAVTWTEDGHNRTSAIIVVP